MSSHGEQSRDTVTVAAHRGENPGEASAGESRGALVVLEGYGTLVGSRIGRHVVLDVLGRGGMGEVYRAYDPQLQREVALKCLRKSVVDSEKELRIEVEARAMASLSHPNVVAVYDVEMLSDGELVLVMELVDGPSLRAWLGERSRTWRETVDAFIAAGRGLEAAHNAGILHRDFKPANVLVAESTLKVTDFGLAKLSRKPHASVAPPDGDSQEDDDGDVTRD